MLKYIFIGAIIVVAIVLLRRLFGRKPIEPFSQPPPKLIPKDGDSVTAEIQGQELEIDAAVLDEVRRLTDAGQKIEAIKHLREATGLDLTRAKEIVDSLDRLRK
jgi:Ribosomal protein L7/L12 C-terminal domain